MLSPAIIHLTYFWKVMAITLARTIVDSIIYPRFFKTKHDRTLQLNTSKGFDVLYNPCSNYMHKSIKI